MLEQNRRNQERIEQQQAPPPQKGPAVTAPAPPLSEVSPPGGPKFLLKSVEFDPSAFLSKAELDAIAAPYVGHKVDLSAVQSIVKAVNDLYDSRGIVTASAVLPPQNLQDGTLHINLVEGKLGEIKVDGAKINSPDYIKGSIGQKPGEVLDDNMLKQRVAAFNWTNDAQIRALLQPGAQFGQTDVVLGVTEPASDTLQVFADNQGVASTGAVEGGVYYRKYGLFGVDDRLTFYGTHSEDNGSDAGNLSYNFPVDHSGGRIGVSYSGSVIKIIEGPFQPLDVTGTSQISTASFSHPLWADDIWLLLGNFSESYGLSTSDQGPVSILNDRTWKETPGITFARRAEDVSFSITPAVSFAHSMLASTGGIQDYVLYNGTGNGSVQLPHDFFATFSGAYQMATQQVLPGDQLFQIGGPTTVRGYPTNSAAGYSGYYVNLELHRAWSGPLAGLDTFALLDAGSVWAVDPRVTTMTSAGVGVRWTMANRLTSEVTAAFPLRQSVDPQSYYALYFKVTGHLLGP